MEESMKKVNMENGDKEILYSQAIRAGKRIYYLDVKKNLKNDLFLAITESKKIQTRDNHMSFEKHKIFLYKEDFDKFMRGMVDVIDYIESCNGMKEEENFNVSSIQEEDENFEEIKIKYDY